MEFASAGVSGVRFMGAVCYKGFVCLLSWYTTVYSWVRYPLGGWYPTLYPWVGYPWVGGTQRCTTGLGTPWVGGTQRCTPRLGTLGTLGWVVPNVVPLNWVPLGGWYPTVCVSAHMEFPVLELAVLESWVQPGLLQPYRAVAVLYAC